MFWDIYEGNIFRPPSEANSLILQATIGCSWDKCTFCTAFAGKEFRAKTFEEIKADVEKVMSYYGDTERIFLADGNALCIDTDELEKIIKYLYTKFRNLKRVNIYGGPQDIMKKTPEELIRLKEAGLKMVYFGLESGSAEVLKKVKKGATPEIMIEVAQKVKAAGLKFSSIFILGLGGQELSEEHARETAKVLTGQDPDFAAALTLMLEPGAPIIEEVESGKMTLITPDQALYELRLVVEGFEPTNCVFRSNHASNYVPIGGTLPADKEKILDQINEGMKRSDFKPEYYRRL
jgi:radical SAM superfamily enzyme YgiQ (UPF0313 family)